MYIYYAECLLGCPEKRTTRHTHGSTQTLLTHKRNNKMYGAYINTKTNAMLQWCLVPHFVANPMAPMPSRHNAIYRA